jgi:hypothetical protein
MVHISWLGHRARTGQRKQEDVCSVGMMSWWRESWSSLVYIGSPFARGYVLHGNQRIWLWIYLGLGTWHLYVCIQLCLLAETEISEWRFCVEL